MHLNYTTTTKFINQKPQKALKINSSLQKALLGKKTTLTQPNDSQKQRSDTQSETHKRYEGLCQLLTCSSGNHYYLGKQKY